MNFAAVTGVLESIETLGKNGQIQKLNLRIEQWAWDPEQGKNVPGTAILQATHFLGQEGKRGSCKNLIGLAVLVNLKLEAREHNNKWYPELKVMHINGIMKPEQEPPMPVSTTAPTAAASKPIDDLPF